MAQPPTTDAEKVAALRQLLPATGAGIYLDTATAGPLPAETDAAMREADGWELRVGRAAAGREEDLAQRLAEAQAVLAALIGADPDAVTPAAGLASATLVGLLALDWQPGDRLFAHPDCEPTVLDGARTAASALGLELNVTPDAVAGTARRSLLPAVSPLSGRRLEGQGPGIVLDASLLAGVAAVSVAELGAEMVVLAADRWALGPDGTAALWLANGLASVARSPVAGQLSRTALVGLARSVGWLEMYVGLEWIFERTARLVRLLLEEVGRIPGVETLTPPGEAAGIVTFRLPPAWDAETASDELGRRVFAITRPLVEQRAVRASVAWFNSEEELGRFAAAVAELARHTPETLPRRPALTVL